MFDNEQMETIIQEICRKISYETGYSCDKVRDVYRRDFYNYEINSMLDLDILMNRLKETVQMDILMGR